jgi:hypothetical protein
VSSVWPSDLPNAAAFMGYRSMVPLRSRFLANGRMKTIDEHQVPVRNAGDLLFRRPSGDRYLARGATSAADLIPPASEDGWPLVACPESDCQNIARGGKSHCCNSGVCNLRPGPETEKDSYHRSLH